MTVFVYVQILGKGKWCRTVGEEVGISHSWTQAFWANNGGEAGKIV